MSKLKKTALIFVLCLYCFSLYIVDGDSMLNTYKDGEIFLTAKLFKVKRYDVIVAEIFDKEERQMISVLKRVVACGGDFVKIQNGDLYINGRPLDDQYSGGEIIYSMPEVKLKSNEYFIIGDNREISEFYIVTRRQIIGKALN